MKMDEKLIEFLWDRFDSSEASELLIEIEGAKLLLKKETAKQTQTVVVQAPQMSAYPTGAGILSGVQMGQAAGTAAAPASFAGTAASAQMAGAVGTGSVQGALSAAPAQQNESAEVQADNSNFVRSPLPGTFYRAASPDDEPFVIIGKKISKGDVIGIVESMKMMNEIVSEYDGTVAEILAENGSMVGYDEKLIRLEA